MIAHADVGVVIGACQSLWMPVTWSTVRDIA